MWYTKHREINYVIESSTARRSSEDLVHVLP